MLHAVGSGLVRNKQNNGGLRPRDRVYKQYNVRVVDKSNVGVGSEDLSQVHQLVRVGLG